MKRAVVFTCEHATNRVPSKVKKAIASKKDTHFAYDIGAKAIASFLSKSIKAPLFLGEISRLVVDLNRSPNHKKRWGELSSHFSETDLSQIEQRYYLGYQNKIYNCIDGLKGSVLHFSIHSFTPELNGEVRNADLGLLFDPSRPGEVQVVKELQAYLKKHIPSVRVRKNYPYLGKTDGFVSCLRKRYSVKKYIGVEVEFNQGTAIQNKPLHKCLLDFLKSVSA